MKKIVMLGALCLGVLFLAGCNNNPQKNNIIEETTPTQQTEAPTMSSSKEWKEITHANFWKNPALFSNSDYKFADIKFSYPSSWDFICCGDMDDRSAHTIYSSTDHDTKLPYTTIADYSLTGCPSNRSTCAIDETVNKTPKEKYDDMTRSVPDSAKIKPAKMLKNLNVSAFNYEMADENGTKVDSYLFKTEQSVVQISFNHFDALEAGFIDSFLEKIEKD